MDRREFLNVTAVSTLGLAAAPADARAWREIEPPDRHGASPSAAASGFELDEATISELQRAMETGARTSHATVEAYAARIDAIDRSGPGLHSVIEVNPEALATADALDAERKGGRVRGPLHGIPVLIKDNIDTADRMHTTAGSLALVDARPARDASIVERLRAAGAVILGKTNLSEWANFRSTRSTSGWSGRGGLTRNGYVLDRNACGSSTGSGVATSANLCAAAVGTETDGSITCPASTNGLVGIKPTVGLVSRAGIIPIAASQDTAGPMARTVADAAILLGAIAGPDARDRATSRAAARLGLDYTTFLDANGLKGARVGVARNLFGANERVGRLMEQALDDLRHLGAILVDPADIPNAGKYDAQELEVLLYEFKDGLNAYLASLAADGGMKTLADLIAFNDTHRAEEMPYFGQEIFAKAQRKGPLTSSEYVAARRACRQLSRTLGIDLVMTKHRLDALVAPTGDPPSLTDLVNGDHFTASCTTPPAVAGYPHVTVPAGSVFGLPVGLSFIGRAWSEGLLIKLAYAYEQATRHRQPPRFLPSAEISPTA